MRLKIGLLLLLLIGAACAPTAPPAELPTLAVLPTLSATPTLIEASAQPTTTPPPTATLRPTATPTWTVTPFPTATPFPTETPPVTVEPTLAAISTATQAILEAPRFATFTPVPGGVVPTGTPRQLADVVITERQFQEEVDRLAANKSSIDSAYVDFVPGAINVELTASGGEALITGLVIVNVQLTGDFATISIGEIRTNAPEPPEAYIQTVATDFFPLMLETLDTILKQRLGPEQKLRTITVTDNAIEVTLLVPQ